MLFENDDSDGEIDFKTGNEYAKNYNNWRKKEELHKLKTKYGDDVENDSSSSSEDDDDSDDLEEIEKDFYITLSSLKNKDPKIYDDKVTFFDKEIDLSVKRKKKDQPMFLKDYERKLLLEKGGHISDSEDEIPRSRSPTYVEEQNLIKKNLKDALSSVDDEAFLKTREKTKVDVEKEEADYKLWLLGQVDNLKDSSAETKLKPLKDYWSDPNLKADEKFLRDYILNKRFLEKEKPDHIPTYEEIVHDSDEGLSEDEEQVDAQEEFEHKYNYRFEEPDTDFIKRYPRTMENSLRRSDDRRKVKRAEVKERKQKEKQEKMDELKQLRNLKKKEIEDKLKKLREITGNFDVGFEDQDLDDDFNPDEHDRRMQSLFNDDFYQGEETDQKPEFPEIDEELEIEKWNKFDRAKENQTETSNVPHCEDDDFNMDCEYDPSKTRQELIDNTKTKKRKRKSKFAEAIAEPKPVFDPNDKTYEQYLDEYYKLDCEDIIGDLPCRFKYRSVVPNDFGLTVEEILRANDKELNRWCSIKKAVQHRPDHVEKYDQIAYGKKAQNEALKRKLIPSLFAEDDTSQSNVDNNAPVKSKRNRKKKNMRQDEVTPNNNEWKQEDVEEIPSVNAKSTIKKETNNVVKDEQLIETKKLTKVKKSKTDNVIDKSDAVDQMNKSKKKSAKSADKGKKRKLSQTKEKSLDKKKKTNDTVALSDARLKAFGIKPKKFKNKMKYGNV